MNNLVDVIGMVLHVSNYQLLSVDLCIHCQNIMEQVNQSFIQGRIMLTEPYLHRQKEDILDY